VLTVQTPNLFIVGAPRCGTTAFRSYLCSSGAIAFAEPKEPHFFGQDLHYPSRPADWAEYLSLFPAGDEPWKGDASVFYLYSATAAEEIRARSSDARIIIMVRPPVEMIASLHAENRFNGREDLPDLRAALDAEPARADGLVPPGCRFPSALRYSAIAHYAPQIERYSRTFGPDAVQIVLLEDLQRDPAACVNSVRAMLGLPPVAGASFPVLNQRKQVRSEALRNLHSRAPEPMRRALRLIAPRGLRARSLRAIRRMNAKRMETPAVDEQVRRRVAHTHRQDILFLEDLLRRDLSSWYR
jgi:hypothetical protein